MAGNVVSNVKKYYGGQVPVPGQGDSDGKVKVLVEKTATIEIGGVQTEVELLYDADDLTTPVTPQQLGQWTDENYLIAFKTKDAEGTVRGFILYALETDSTSTDTLVNRATFVNFKEDMNDPGASAYVFEMVEDSSTLTRYLRDSDGELIVKFNQATVEAGAQSGTLDHLIATDSTYMEFEVVYEGGNAYLNLNTAPLADELDDIHDDINYILGALAELPSDEHGYFNSTLIQTPGDGTTENIVIDDFRISQGRDVHGENIEFVPTHQEGGIDYGEVYLNPGTYIFTVHYTLQWVGNPRGTFLPLVTNVGDRPFDFSYEHEDVVRTTRIVTRTTRGKFSLGFPIDADTPSMGIWVKNLEIAQIASYTRPSVIREATREWLDEHPEATTTVQDHSLTHQKLVNGTLNFVTPEMYGAVGDGVTDDTAAIQAAMDSCSVVLFGDKTYIIDVSGGGFGTIGTGGLKCNSNQTLLLGGCTLKAKPDTNTSGFYDIISTNLANNIKIIGGHIVGDTDGHPGSSGEWGFGISIRNSVDVLISGVHIEKCWGDGIFVNPYDIAGTPQISNVTIEHCHIHHCRRQGISVVSGMNIVIDDCCIHDIRGTAPEYAIDIEPDGGKQVRCITIRNLFAPDHYGITVVSPVDDAEVKIVNSFVISLILYTKVYVDSCNIRHIQTTSSSASVLVASHTMIGSLECYGKSSIMLDSCNFYANATASYGGCITLSALNDGPVNLQANNCSLEFIGNGFLFYFIYSYSAGNTASEIEFTNCSFKTSDSGLVAHLPCANAIFKNCKIKALGGDPSIYIRGGGSLSNSLQFIGCQMNFGANFLIGGNPMGAMDVIFERCLFTNGYNYLGYLDSNCNFNFKFKDNIFNLADPTRFPNLRYLIPSSSSATASLVVINDSLFRANYGSTADRPLGLQTYDTGYEYFDTTLGKKIVWDGTTWINMDGTPLV